MPPPDPNVAPRIVILVYSLARGGAERMTAELARAWSDHGCAVTVITLAPAETDFFHLDQRVKHIRLAFPADPNRTRLQMVVANIQRTWAIRRILARVRPDVAVGMMSSAAILLALASVGLKMKTFGSERTYPPMMPLGTSKEQLRRFTYGLLTGVIGQTEAAAQWLRENTCATRVHVIPNHIDLPLRSQSPAIPISSVLQDDRRCILAVGRMTEEKQFSHLIDAFTVLAVQFPQWDLVIAGDGPDRPELAARIASAGLQRRVHLPGAVGNIGDWHQRADVFAMTSRFEGFPNALLEAMAHGTPSIAYDCMTGPSELIQNGRNGLLVTLNDKNGLVGGLSKMMAEEGLRKGMGDRARSVSDRFSVGYATDLWLGTFGLRQKAD